MTKIITYFIFLNLIIGIAKAQPNLEIPKPIRQDTLNGSITIERSWWDVQHYDITLKPLEFPYKFKI